MIFLSHKSEDKPLVEPFAAALAAAYGKDSVFYDSWSIQPGDGIIDKMNQGLEAAKFLILFISRQSLDSKMVSLEWQNALFKSVKGTLKIVPVRIQDVPLPAILANTLYIDLPTQGLDNAVRQVVDVVSGQNTYRPAEVRFENVRAHLHRAGSRGTIEIRVEAYMEPQSRYMFLFEIGHEPPSHNVVTDMMHESAWSPGLAMDNGKICDGQLIAVNRPTSIGFPLIVEFHDLTNFAGVLRAVSQNRYESVPVIE